jgi:hypothetical protein
LFGREIVWNVDSVVEVTKLVKETTLLLRPEVDSAQGRAQAAATVVDDQLQAVLAADALSLQDAQEGSPFFVVFATAQLPKQDFTAVRVRPNTHGDEDGTLEATFHCSLPSLAVATYLTIGTQHGHPDGIYLQDRGHLLCVAVGIEMDELV